MEHWIPVIAAAAAKVVIEKGKPLSEIYHMTPKETHRAAEIAARLISEAQNEDTGYVIVTAANMLPLMTRAQRYAMEHLGRGAMLVAVTFDEAAHAAWTAENVSASIGGCHG